MDYLWCEIFESMVYSAKNNLLIIFAEYRENHFREWFPNLLTSY